MRSCSRIKFVATVLLVLAAGLAGWGCGTGAVASAPDPQTTTSPQVHASSADRTAAAISRIEALFGLPEGAVSTATGPTIQSPSDMGLDWDGGHAVIDADTGRIRFVTAESPGSGPEKNLSESDLDAAVSLVLATLGWDTEALAAEGFTATETKTMDHGAGPEYTSTWLGHDEQGLANGGLIEVALFTKSGRLAHFGYIAGPRAAAARPATIGKDDAIRIALDVVGTDPPVDPTTEAPPGGSTTTGPPLGIVVRSAELVHSAAPGITGGKDMLVWVVKLGGRTRNGKLHAEVYIDAVAGKALSEAY